jgi:uncharacterized membrane protein
LEKKKTTTSLFFYERNRIMDYTGVMFFWFVVLIVALVFVINVIIKFFRISREVSENKRKLAHIEGILVKQFGKVEIKNQESDSDIYDPLRSDKKE